MHESQAFTDARGNGSTIKFKPSGMLGRVLLVMLVPFLLYSHSWGHDFTGWDDTAYISDNSSMRDVAGLKRIWFSSDNEQYYPLTFTSYWLEYRLWGDRPAGYHVVNAVLHALNAGLVFLVLQRLGLSTWAATVAALAFGLHPMQVMSVAWLAERKNLLSCFWLLLALAAWIRFRRGGGAGAYVAVVACFTGALLSKSAVAVAPLALLAMDLLVLGRPMRSSVSGIWPLVLLSAAAVWITSRFEQEFIDPTVYSVVPTMLHRVLLATTAIWAYLGRLLIPIGQSPLYAAWTIDPHSWRWWMGACALALATGVAARYRSNLPGMFQWGLLFFLIFLLPILGMVAYGNLAVSPISDHYDYVPCIGLFAALAIGLDRVRRSSARHSRVVSTAVVMGLLACGVDSWNYMEVFRDGPTMWRYTLAKNPDCFPAHHALGRWAIEQNEPGKAIDHFQRAVRIHPERCEGIAGLGEVQAQLGQWDEARRNLDSALLGKVRLSSALIARAAVAEHDGQLELASELLQSVPAKAPWDALACLRLGKLRLRSGATGEARVLFEKVVGLRSDDASGYQGLVECDRMLKNWPSAIEWARRGLAVQPERIALKNLLALTLATCPVDQLRDGAMALRLAEEVVQSLGGSNFQGLETLAAARAETGDFKTAAELSREAARLAQDAGHGKAGRANVEWAAQYDQHRPRRDE